MIIAIVSGSRDWSDRESIYKALDESCCQMVVQGGCPTGADFIAREYARNKSLILVTFYANWKKYGNSAGPIRNERMLDAYKDNDQAIVLCFQKNFSRGTQNAIDIANQFYMHVKIHRAV